MERRRRDEKKLFELGDERGGKGRIIMFMLETRLIGSSVRQAFWRALQREKRNE